MDAVSNLFPNFSWLQNIFNWIFSGLGNYAITFFQSLINLIFNTGIDFIQTNAVPVSTFFLLMICLLLWKIDRLPFHS